MRLPYPVHKFVEVGERVGKGIEDFLANPTRAIESLLQSMNDEAEAERARQADKAVGIGTKLIWLRQNPGDDGFSKHLSRLHMSPRTARNKMALALFANSHPDLYAKLKPLGPSKLYRIAVLHPEQIRKLELDDTVKTARGAVLFRQLTARELEGWLREQVPVKERASWVRRVQQQLRRAARLCEQNADQPVDLAELRYMDASIDQYRTWLRERIAKAAQEGAA
jgi:hypothetical protein